MRCHNHMQGSWYIEHVNRGEFLYVQLMMAMSGRPVFPLFQTRRLCLFRWAHLDLLLTSAVQVLRDGFLWNSEYEGNISFILPSSSSTLPSPFTCFAESQLGQRRTVLYALSCFSCRWLHLHMQPRGCLYFAKIWTKVLAVVTVP